MKMTDKLILQRRGAAERSVQSRQVRSALHMAYEDDRDGTADAMCRCTHSIHYHWHYEGGCLYGPADNQPRCLCKMYREVSE